MEYQDDNMNFIFMITLSFLYGFFMKLADLHNEHNKNIFDWDPNGISFGILWGIFGAIILLGFEIKIAIYYFAALVSYCIRKKIDCRNHRISISVIIVLIFLSILLISKFKDIIPVKLIPNSTLIGIWIRSDFDTSLKLYSSLIFNELIPFLILIPVLGKLHDHNYSTSHRWNELEFTLICYIFLPISWWELFLKMDRSYYLSPILFSLGYEISRFLEPFLKNK